METKLQFLSLQKLYGRMLIAGAAYYAVLLLLNPKSIYVAWLGWSWPTPTSADYLLLVLLYMAALLTPLLMAITGARLFGQRPVQWYWLVPLAILLALSDTIGKILLVLGIVVFLYRWQSRSKPC